MKMLYRAGFAGVYRVAEMPDHDDFRETPLHARRRTVLFAATAPLRVAGFEKIDEPRDVVDPWSKTAISIDGGSIAGRIWRFLRRPWRAQYISLAYKARQVFPEMPMPLRLPFGAWWLAQKSALDDELIHEGFEDAEMAFVDRLLRPGMTVLDAGAHHGLYTLLASKRVGRRGRVIAFEPSPRERKRLRRHLRANRCKNVDVQSCALGEEQQEANLFLVEGREDWCNSLRAPQIDARTVAVRVEVQRVDDVLEKLGFDARGLYQIGRRRGGAELPAGRAEDLGGVEAGDTCGSAGSAHASVGLRGARDHRVFDTRRLLLVCAYRQPQSATDFDGAQDV